MLFFVVERCHLLLFCPGEQGRSTQGYLWDRCRFSGYRFHLYFKSRVSKEDNFSKAGCRNVLKGKVFLNRVVIQSNFCDLEYAFDRLFLESDII